MATWSDSTLGIEAVALRELGLKDAEDPEIFAAAKAQNAIVMWSGHPATQLGYPVTD
jgi:predicted nuclease of predicted toxin-antitoxin system